MYVHMGNIYVMLFLLINYYNTSNATKIMR